LWPKSRLCGVGRGGLWVGGDKFLFVFWATPRKKTKTSAAQGDYAWLCQPATAIRPQKKTLQLEKVA